jgi:hypothetical protein
MTATVLAFPTPKDGGKARIRARRVELGLADNFRWPSNEPIIDLCCADPEDTGMPSDSPYSAPAHDGA